MAVPSKGRMAEDTLQLLRVCTHHVEMRIICPSTIRHARYFYAHLVTLKDGSAGLPAERLQAQPKAIHS